MPQSTVLEDLRCQGCDLGCVCLTHAKNVPQTFEESPKFVMGNFSCHPAEPRDSTKHLVVGGGCYSQHCKGCPGGFVWDS